MAYSLVFPFTIENSQRFRWLFWPNGSKIERFEEITSDFTGYFFVTVQKSGSSQ